MLVGWLVGWLIDWLTDWQTDLFIYLFILRPGTQFPRAEKLSKGVERVWNGHGADSEIGNVSARLK